MEINCLFVALILIGTQLVVESKSTIPDSPPIKHLRLDHGLKLNVSIGTPPQTFSLKLNTVTSGTWVRRPFDKEEHPFIKLGDENHFYLADISSTSVSLEKKWEQYYQVGITYEGEMFRDTIQIGDLVVENQLFDVLHAETGRMAGYFPLDGMLGVGSLGRQGPLLHDDPIKSLHDGGLIPRRMFSLHLDRRDDEHQQFNGTLILGGTDARYHLGPINYVPISRLWDFQPDYVQFEGSSSFVDDGKYFGHKALIDSTSNIILGPQSKVEALFGALNLNNGLHMFPSCEEAYKTNIRLTISIEGQKYQLDMVDLIIKLRSKQQDVCFLGIGSKIEDYGYPPVMYHWILGTPFLKKYYTVYDYGRKLIGFAKATDRD